MEANQEFRRMAAAMDLRIEQLTAEGVHGLAVIERVSSIPIHRRHSRSGTRSVNSKD